MFDIVGIDSPCVDLCVNLAAFPTPDSFQEAREVSWQGGGKVATGLVAAARLGANCSITGQVGDDQYGKYCIADFQRHGIATGDLTVRKNSTTSFAVVVSDNATYGRSILYAQGSSPVLQPQELPLDSIKNAKYFYFSYVDATSIQAAKTAKENGVKVVMDADNYAGDLESAIPYVDVFIASQFIYRRYYANDNYEANCRDFSAKGPEMVVFTLGAKGCAGFDGNEFFQLDSFPVPQVVDTVGAGDVFHGAYIAGLLKGYSAKEAARFASAVSAIKCTRIGGRSGIPSFAIADAFIKTGQIDYEEIDKRVEFYKRGIEHV